MRKKQLAKWALPVLWGWFFSVQNPGQVPGTVVKTEVSGFKSEALCQSYLSDLQDMLEYLGVKDMQISKCQYRQEA